MRRRILMALLAAALALPVVAAQPPTLAHAEPGGLELESTFTYTVDPAMQVVHVRADIIATNKNSEAYSRGLVYTQMFFPVPTNSRAYFLSDGEKAFNIYTEPIPGSFSHASLVVGLSGNLHLNRSVDRLVMYDVFGDPPRGNGTFRMSPGYFAFEAYAIADPGKGTINIVVPDGYTIDDLGSEWKVARAGGTTTYTYANIPDPDNFVLFAEAHDDSLLSDTDVSTGDGDEFEVHAWSNDAEWGRFVSEQIETGVPALTELVGQPWPVDDTVNVYESITPYVYGYAGWYDASNDTISIGEDLDAEVVLHELSHAWFNRAWFADRWLNEGFAQVYSNLALEELDETPIPPEAISDSDPGKVSLNDWSNPRGLNDVDQERERFGYNASYSVVQTITDEIGEEAMREVLAAVAEGQLAYRGDGEPDKAKGATDWRRFLDYVELIGGSEQALDLIRDHVITSDQESLFKRREEVKTSYLELEERGGEWAPPLVVREKMGSWSFGAADIVIEAADEALGLRDELDVVIEEIGTDASPLVEEAYEDAEGDLDEATATIQSHLDTARVLLDAARANRGSHGIIGTIGLLGDDLDATLDEAIEAFVAGDLATADAKAQEIITAVDDETSSGLIRLAILLGVLLLAAGVVLLVRRRRTTKALAAATAAEAAAAIEGVEGDDQPVDGADQPVETADRPADISEPAVQGTEPDQEGPSPE